MNEPSSGLCCAWKNASTVLAKFLKARLEFRERCSAAAAKEKESSQIAQKRLWWFVDGRWNACVPRHATPAEVRGHLEGADPFLLPQVSWDGPQAIGLGGRCLPAEPIWTHNFYFLEITYPFGDSTERCPLPHCVHSLTTRWLEGQSLRVMGS